ncbi:MAG: orotidine 5'-phosphate decarboxylase, partial [Oleiagrimonas sp.]|nr:orotidine 5'-phosphate decarboxylase [Oleiagrimonas sp.]
GLMISSSRAILYAGTDTDFAASARAAARAMRDQINRCRVGRD